MKGWLLALRLRRKGRVMRNLLLRLMRLESKHWRTGFISAEDTHCFVDCDCDYSGYLNVSDYKIARCPKCGKGYITEFNCYRIPAWLLRLLARA